MALAHHTVLEKAQNQHDKELLHLALEGVASTFSRQLTKLLRSELKKSDDPKMIDEFVKDVVPQLLESSFQHEVLEANAETQKCRVVLLYMLSSAEMKNCGDEPLLLLSPMPSGTNDEPKESLTTEEAAKFLGVSRTHLISLIDSEILPARRTSGGHRRIPKTAVFAYKQEMKQRQSKGLDAMMESTSALGLYDEELEGIPRRSKNKA